MDAVLHGPQAKPRTVTRRHSNLVQALRTKHWHEIRIGDPQYKARARFWGTATC